MAAINAKALFETATQKGLAAAKGHAKDLRNYIQARTTLIVDGVARIAADRLAGDIDNDDVKFAFREIKASEKTALLAIQATLKAAAQDAINAVLAVAATAVNQAVGIPIL
jgi:hypothetical protein